MWWMLLGCDESIVLGKGAEDTTDTLGPAPATAALYVHSGTTLYTWDTVAQDVAFVGGFHDVVAGSALSGVLDIAIDADGALYAADGTDLYAVDAEDAGCTWVATLPDAGTGLTFLADGRLVVAGAALVAVDLASGDTEEIVPAGVYATSGDVVGVPQGTLQWSVRGSGSDDWISVDPDTGAATRLGAVGASELWGVAFAEDTLFAFGSDGSVLSVDPVTGAGTRLATADVAFYGATTNPVTW